MVRAILYAATITRPDLVFAALVISQIASERNKEHNHAAWHILRDLKATLDVCLTFNNSGGLQTMLGYADADWWMCRNPSLLPW